MEDAHSQFLDENKVAKITQRAVQSLRNDRMSRQGIPYYKVGRSVRYSLKDVLEFMDKHRIETKEL